MQSVGKRRQFKVGGFVKHVEFFETKTDRVKARNAR